MLTKYAKTPESFISSSLHVICCTALVLRECEQRSGALSRGCWLFANTGVSAVLAPDPIILKNWLSWATIILCNVSQESKIVVPERLWLRMLMSHACKDFLACTAKRSPNTALVVDLPWQRASYNMNNLIITDLLHGWIEHEICQFVNRTIVSLSVSAPPLLVQGGRNNNKCQQLYFTGTCRPTL